MALSLETINYLQEEQRKLDIFIHQQNKLEMKDTFYLRKIALLVEIGEVANELKTFKYWKKDKKISLEKTQEELIDCLHFFLSLANCSQIDFNNYSLPKVGKKLKDINKDLLILFKESGKLNCFREEKKEYPYYRWLSTFEKLCQQIGFDEKKLLNVYNRKNKINHQRQLENY